MVNVIIDECTNCLKDNKTGDIIETEVVRIKRKSFLSKFNPKTGWYINWSELLKENEIYALVLKGTVDIQGLVALQKIENYEAVYITWMCVAPHNNQMINPLKKYIGVGGHLFAIAVDCSLQFGYGGAVTGNAANKELLMHYCEVFGAIHLGILHPYHFFIDEDNAAKVKEVYDYEWTQDEL